MKERWCVLPGCLFFAAAAVAASTANTVLVNSVQLIWPICSQLVRVSPKRKDDDDDVYADEDHDNNDDRKDDLAGDGGQKHTRKHR